MARHYTADEDLFIREHYKTNTYFDVAMAIGRDPRSVRERAITLGLRKQKRKEWTHEECVKFLSNIQLSNQKLAEMFNRNPRSVSAKRAWFRSRIDILNENERFA